MSNEKKSNFGDNKLLEKYIVHRIPEGSLIHKLELYYSKFDSSLYGLKFFDKKSLVLLDCCNLHMIYNF
jgi:hypothetical protein